MTTRKNTTGAKHSGNMISDGIPSDVRAKCTPEQIAQLEQQNRIYDALDRAAHGATHSQMVQAVAAYVVDQAMLDTPSIGDGIDAAQALVGELTAEARDYCKFKMEGMLGRLSPEEIESETDSTLEVLKKKDPEVHSFLTGLRDLINKSGGTLRAG